MFNTSISNYQTSDTQHKIHGMMQCINNIKHANLFIIIDQKSKV